MEHELIEQLRDYRTGLRAHVSAPSFGRRPDRDRILTALLATDRLLAALVLPLPPVGLDPEILTMEAS